MEVAEEDMEVQEETVPNSSWLQGDKL